MKTVSEREALRGLNMFLRDMYCWCDVNGEFGTGMVSVSRKTVRKMRRLVDAILEGRVVLMDGYDSVYAQLSDRDWHGQ